MTDPRTGYRKPQADEKREADRRNADRRFVAMRMGETERHNIPIRVRKGRTN